MQRTIRIQLQPDPDTALVLTQTIEQYTWSFNAVCQHGWEHGLSSGTELHKATYYDHRTLTGLPAQLVCAARVKATEALKSVRARKPKKAESCQGGFPPSKLFKTEVVSCHAGSYNGGNPYGQSPQVGRPKRPSPLTVGDPPAALAHHGAALRNGPAPQSKFCAIRYDARSYTVWFDRHELTLLTLDGRIKLPFQLAEYYRQYLSWTRTSADLIRDRKGRWWLHVVMETAAPVVVPTEETVGVDLGIKNPATDSRNEFYGDKHWQDIEDRTFELRRRLQFHCAQNLPRDA